MRFSLVRWLQNSSWSIRTKLLISFLSIAAFILLLVLVSWLVINDLGIKLNQVANTQTELNRVKELSDASRALQASLDSARVDLTFTAGSVKDSISGLSSEQTAFESYQPYLVDYDRQRLVIQESRNRLKKLGETIMQEHSVTTISPAMMERTFEQLDRPLTELVDKLDQITQFAKNRRLQQVDTAWSTLSRELNDSMALLDQFSTNLTNQVEVATNASQRAVSDANNARSISQFIILLAGVTALLLAVGFGFTLTYVFTQPVEQLRKRLVSLAEGDLASPLEVSNRDQFGQLADTFNRSVDRLGGVVHQVQTQSTRLSYAAEEIASASNLSAVVSVEQAGAVAEATIIIEELSYTAQEIAEAASLVSEAAEQALSSASDGQQTVRESILGINSLKQRVRTITDRILALSERSQRVGHIIEQVASIADQTHLLALNAAIESAAAGENGKRFAVVAANVKQLAERSRQATKDVQAVLNEIQYATNASVMATEQGMKEAERGVVLAHRTGDVNENIIQMVERTVQLANAISLATQQQRSSSEQVVANMRQLAQVIGEGANTARESSKLASSLDSVALELRRLATQFKVKPESATPLPPAGGNNISTPAMPAPVPHITESFVPGVRHIPAASILKADPN